MGQPRPLFRLFSVFSNKQFFTTNQCEKMSYPSSIRRLDLNPRPLECESPPISTLAYLLAKLGNPFHDFQYCLPRLAPRLVGLMLLLFCLTVFIAINWGRKDITMLKLALVIRSDGTDVIKLFTRVTVLSTLPRVNLFIRAEFELKKLSPLHVPA